jgi:transmembrane sensor
LEGSVREDPVILSHPGEQARVSKDGKVSLVKNVNLEEVISWKNGYFEFTDADIKDVMRQVARWYGVTIVYDKYNDTALFTGQFGRNLTATQVFQVLSETGYHFSIKDKTILVE